MRYLIYASRSKVAMLHPQLPGGRPGTHRGTLGLDLKLAKAERSTSTTQDERFFEQLSEVENWIYQYDEVGTIDEPKAWIHLRGEVTAANFTSQPLRSYSEPPDMSKEAVVFAARDSSGNRLLLGGSGYHLTASTQFGSLGSGPWEQTLYYSSAVGLLRLLETYRDEIEHPVGARDRPLPHHEAGKEISRVCDAVLSGRVLSQPLGTCDLLAKRLATYQTEGGLTTLATPLTVALLD